MTLNLTDRELIDELRNRGYRVAKADRIRTASVQADIRVEALVGMGRDEGYIRHVYERLGMQLGAYLISNGAVPVIEEIGTEFHRTFRASVTVVVSDPQFDWPYLLKMEK